MLRDGMLSATLTDELSYSSQPTSSLVKLLVKAYRLWEPFGPWYSFCIHFNLGWTNTYSPSRSQCPVRLSPDTLGLSLLSSYFYIAQSGSGGSSTVVRESGYSQVVPTTALISLEELSTILSLPCLFKADVLPWRAARSAETSVTLAANVFTKTDSFVI